MMTTTATVTQPPVNPRLKSYDILLAEDDLLTADSIRRFLEEFNINVMHARDGEEALQLFSKHSFDLVISDFEMPKKNGLELLEQIRGTTPAQKVIFLTAYSQKEILADALASGVSAYYLKPIDLARLMSQVAKILNLRADELVSRAHYPLKIENASIDLQHVCLQFSGCPGNVRLIDLIIGRLPGRDHERIIISLRFDEKFGLHKNALQLVANLIDDLISLLHIEPADIDLGGAFFENMSFLRGNAPGKIFQCRRIRKN